MRLWLTLIVTLLWAIKAYGACTEDTVSTPVQGSGTLALTFPGGTTTGDECVAVVNCYKSNQSSACTAGSPPSGWTQAWCAVSTIIDANTETLTTCFYTHTATGSDANPTFTWTNVQNSGAQIICGKGCTTNIDAGTSATSSCTTTGTGTPNGVPVACATAASATLVDNGDLVIAAPSIVSNSACSGNSWSTPSGYTSPQSTCIGGGSGNSFGGVFDWTSLQYQAVATVGPITYNATFSASGSPSYGVLEALIAVGGVVPTSSGSSRSTLGTGSGSSLGSTGISP